MIVSNFSIKHGTTVLVLILMIVIIGLQSYNDLPRESAPDINVPVVFVSTFYEGAAPEDIENLITRPIERKLKSIADIKEMRSDSAESLSLINIEFEADVDIDSALQKVREKVDQAGPYLPVDLHNPPDVKEFSFNEEFPVMFMVISGDSGLARLKKHAEDLEREVETVQGVLEATIIGGREREILVEFDSMRLAPYGLSMAEIMLAIQNNHLNTPSGSIDIGDAKYNLKVPGEFTTLAEINRMVVATREGKPIYLSDIATVKDSFKDRDSYARLNGVESVTIKITKRVGENLLRIADECKAIGAEFQERLPEGINITYTSDASKEVLMMVSNLENNILSGLLLVLLVIFFSLGWRNAALVSSAIPLSMLLTFIALRVMGITLNMVVLFSLVLALGMLVDNAIVIIENIYRHHSQGKRLVRAAMEGTAEVGWPVITSTATTVAAFLPMVFWPGMMGQFMSYLPKTVIITLLASLFVAMVINPTLGAMFIRVSRKDRRKAAAAAAAETAENQPATAGALEAEPSHGPVLRIYRRLLHILISWRLPLTSRQSPIRLSLGLRLITLCVFYALLVGAVHLHSNVLKLGTELFPDTEPNRVLIELKAPEGTNIQKTNALALQAEQLVEHYGNVKFVTTSVGAGSGQGLGANSARIVIDMVDRELRLGKEEAPEGDERIYFANSNETMQALRDELVEAIIGADVKVNKEDMGPPTGPPINVEISGDDYAVLARLAEELQQRIQNVPGMINLEDDYVKGLPEFRVEINKERAAMLNLDTYLIGQMIKASVNGIKVGNYREAEKEYDITARLPLELRSSITDVMNIRIPDRQGTQTPLSSVAQVIAGSGLGVVKHIDQKRVVTVMADVDLEGKFQPPVVLQEVREIAEQMELPLGYVFDYTGENEEQEESEEFMMSAFLTALFLIAIILVTQFNSVATPFIILNSVVLSLLGVFFGLAIMGQPFGIIMTGMAVISLAGVVVNNAIVLIDYIELLRRHGLSVTEAILRAGCTRFRPVMLTAITTILGLTPMAIGVSFDFRGWMFVVGDESSQYWGPMAIAVIFGLAVATLLTLFIVPALYSLIESARAAVFHRSPATAESTTEPAGSPVGEPVADSSPAFGK